MSRRTVLLVQLPIPPLGPGRIRGNVPLAAGYLKMYAQLQGLGQHFDIRILPSGTANTLSDRGLVQAISNHAPWVVGFSCYLWNIDRSLWIAEQLKQLLPQVKVLLGGPEITADNAWVLSHPVVDYAAIGEGEQTFTEFLHASLYNEEIPTHHDIAGLYVANHAVADRSNANRLALPLLDQSSPGLSGFKPRKPLQNLDAISSPYLTGLLDAADEEMLLLETIRGCIFKCKFCYYPKSYDGLYFLSEEKITANLRHALDRGAKEVIFLDPTLNQRKGFEDFLRLLIRQNSRRQLTFFGELRAEGIKESTADLLALAGFTEVEVGLQSIDPLAMQLMDRKNNLQAVERGCKAMLAAGIRVKVDLIIGLPGDTVESVRRGMHYLKESGIYSDVQVFNLAILPGTSFRQEAQELGLIHQPRPPYYVRRTPSLRQEDIFDLMHEAAEIFDLEWDPLPEPVLPTHAVFHPSRHGLIDHHLIDLDRPDAEQELSAGQRSQAFTLWLRSSDFGQHIKQACRWVSQLLQANPFTTLQVVLEPLGDPERITSETLEELWSACQERPTYMDRYYAMQPGRPIGAKRLVVLLDEARTVISDEWMSMVEEQAAISYWSQASAKIPMVLNLAKSALAAQ